MRSVLCFLLLGFGFRSMAAPADTVRLYFDLGIARLTPVSQHVMDSLVYYEKLIPGKKLGIIGYADFLGSEESNVSLSENRAKNVQEYLVSLGIKASDIQTVIGKGEVRRDGMTDKSGFPTDRRVDIIPGGFKEPPKPVVAVKPAVITPPIIDISKVKKNEAIKLENMFFEPGSHKMRAESQPTLQKLLAVMKDNPTLVIQIEGHICCLDPHNTEGYDYDTQEYKLSENRAKAVYDYLEDNGVDEERMKYKGFGKKKPLVDPEETEEDQNKNRRVEIRILKK